MKKILLILFLFLGLLPLFSYSKLPPKYVLISKSSNGDMVYGNTRDAYGNGSAWIVWNFKNGRSSISRYYANCSNNTLGYSDNVVYQKRDLQGKVLSQSGRGGSGLRFNDETVIPDTVGESIFNFICYGMY